MKSKLLFIVCAMIAFTFAATFSSAQCNNVTSGGTIGSDQTVCGGYNPANITNITFPSGGTGTLEYQWQSSIDNISWPNIPGATLSSYDPNVIGSTTYYKRLSRRSGCTTYDGVSNIVTKTVNPIPIVNITAGGPTTFCGPGSVLLSFIGGAGLTYQWKRNNTVIAGATNQNYTANTTGVYTLTVTITSTGCSGVSNSIVVTVHTSLATTITESGFNPCGASTALLQVQDDAGYSFQWYEGSNSLPGTNSSQLYTGHNGTYSCTITNTCGSYPSAPYNLISGQLSMFPYGYISPSGSTNICSGGGFVQLNEGFHFFSNYQWYKDGVAIAGETNYSYVATQAGNYNLKMTDLCLFSFSPFDFYSNFITVTVSGSLPSQVVTANGPTTFCNGLNVILTADQATAWSWRKNGTPISGATQRTYTATTSGVYECFITNSCGSILSNPTTVTNLGPTVSISANGPLSFCPGGSVLFTATTTGAGISYQWMQDGNPIAGATNSTYTATVAAVWKCNATNSCGTASSNSMGTSLIPVSVTILPAGTITICQGGVTLTSSSGGSYQWKLNGSNINGATQQTYSTSQPGSYTVTLTNSCGTFTSNTVTAVAGSCTTGLQFDGNNDYVKIPNSTSYNFGVGDFSVEGWIRMDIQQVAVLNPTLISHRNGTTGFFIYFNGGKLTAQLGGVNNSAFGPDLRDNNCHHVAITRSGSTINFYVDGALVGTSGNGNFNMTVSDFVYIGNDDDDSFLDGLKGKIMEVRMWNTARTVTQIQANMNTQLVGNEAGLVGYWRLNDGSGQIANDISTVNNDGQLGSSTSSDASDPVFAVTCPLTSCATPAAVITAGGSTTICSGSNVTLNANSGVNITYQWVLNGTSISGATNQSYNATAAGNYQCIETNSCGPGTSNTISVTLLPVSVSITPAVPVQICSGSSVTFTSSTSGIGGTIQWKLNGNTINGATQSTYIATQAGSYTSTITNSCGTFTSNSVTVTLVSCATGLQFDGANDYVKVPNNTSYNIGTGDFSVEGWINMDIAQVATNYPALISHRLSTNGFSGFFVFFSAGKLIAQFGGINSPAFGPDLRDNLCHHVAVTRNGGSNLSFYVDGVLVGTTGISVVNITAADFLHIGNDAADNFNDGFKGKIMEVRMWNTSRTITQIQSAMNTQLTGNETGLIGYWRLDDGSGQIANDYSTVNNDGQLGSTTTSDANDPVFTATCPITTCIPPSAIISAAGSTTFCTGGSVVLNANTGGGLTYQWKLNTNTLAGATLSSYTASVAGTYTCIVSNSCSNTVSNGIVVTVNPLPTASITAGGATTFCSGGSVLLTANSGGGLTYQWKLNGTDISGATSISYSASAAGNYTCAVSNSCPISSISNSITVTVLITPSTTITTNGPTTFCNGSSVLLSASTGNGQSYQWSVDGNNIALATASSYTATTGGNYACTISNLCGTVNSNSISVTVNTTPLTPSAISGSSTICLNSFAIQYTINPVNGATSYSWTVPSGASISQGQGTTEIYVDFGGSVANGNICVAAVNSCGSSSNSCLAITTTSVPQIPNAISGSASACANTTNNVYSISGVIGATSYTWTIPSGASFVSGQGTSSITLSFGPNGATGNICVYPGNACGTNFTCKAITAVTGTTTPASISGTTTPCANSTNVSYSCPAVAGASSYVWTAPSGATITSGQGTTTITMNFNSQFSIGTIGVSSVNCAGTSAARTLQVYGIPAMPGSITGPTSAVCSGTTNVQYSIAAVPGANSYTWTAPSNATITNGQGTTTVRLNFGNGFSSGTLSVRAVNGCGNSGTRAITITSVPPMPGTITGPATFCANSNVNYSIAAVTGATTYNWDVPTGASITAGQGTTTITVHHGTHSGKVRVRSGNACGYSAYQILNVTKTCREGGEFISDETDFDVTVYPNPSASQFTISVKSESGEKFNFILRDLTGRLIEMRENQLTDKQLEFGSDLLNGIYVAEIILGDERKWIRIIKQD